MIGNIIYTDKLANRISKNICILGKLKHTLQTSIERKHIHIFLILSQLHYSLFIQDYKKQANRQIAYKNIIYTQNL